MSIAPEERVLLAEHPFRNDGSGQVTAPRTFGRTTARTSRHWACGPVLDQGRTNACIAFSTTAAVMSGPSGDTTAAASTANRYAFGFHERLFIAPQDPYTLAEARGQWGSHLWTDGTIDGIRDAVLNIGPVALGLPWYPSMFRTNRAGRVKVQPTSDPGSHAILCVGYQPAAELGRWTGPAFRFRNSWGKSWGFNGDGWLKAKDLHRLLNPTLHDAAPPQDRAWVPAERNGATIAALHKAHPDPKVS